MSKKFRPPKKTIASELHTIRKRQLQKIADKIENAKNQIESQKMLYAKEFASALYNQRFKDRFKIAWFILIKKDIKS